MPGWTHPKRPLDYLHARPLALINVLVKLCRTGCLRGRGGSPRAMVVGTTLLPAFWLQFPLTAASWIPLSGLGCVGTLIGRPTAGNRPGKQPSPGPISPKDWGLAFKYVLFTAGLFLKSCPFTAILHLPGGRRWVKNHLRGAHLEARSQDFLVIRRFRLCEAKERTRQSFARRFPMFPNRFLIKRPKCMTWVPS